MPHSETHSSKTPGATPNRADDSPRLIAIGGGKGGVGKTVIAASMAVGLAMLKRRVVVLDADLAGANLHTAMGIEKPVLTTHAFFSRKKERLEDISIPHPDFENLRLVCGAGGSLEIANLKPSQRERFIRQLRLVDADFVILDLGAGSSYNVIDLFLEADLGVILTNPDPLSILESYHFVKQALFRSWIQALKDRIPLCRAVKKLAASDPQKNAATVEEILAALETTDRAGVQRMRQILHAFHPALLLNKVDGAEDESNASAVKVAAAELLSVGMGTLGVIHRDESVLKALQASVPFIRYDSKCRASRDLADIVVMKILHYGKIMARIKTDGLNRKLGRTAENRKNQVICSVHCYYWEECAYKSGGYPCRMGHLGEFRGFRGENPYTEADGD
jgi:flagellar biosynthesis protein FlhG